MSWRRAGCSLIAEAVQVRLVQAEPQVTQTRLLCCPICFRDVLFALQLFFSFCHAVCDCQHKKQNQPIGRTRMFKTKVGTSIETFKDFFFLMQNINIDFFLYWKKKKNNDIFWDSSTVKSHCMAGSCKTNSDATPGCPSLPPQMYKASPPGRCAVLTATSCFSSSPSVSVLAAMDFVAPRGYQPIYEPVSVALRLLVQGHCGYTPSAAGLKRLFLLPMH